MKLEGWIVRDDIDGSVLVVLGSREYHMENVLLAALEAENFSDIAKKPITIDIPDVGEAEVKFDPLDYSHDEPEHEKEDRSVSIDQLKNIEPGERPHDEDD